MIVRTNFFCYNIQNKNDLAGWMCSKLGNKEPIRLFRGVYFSPLLVNTLLSAIVEIVEKETTGLLHIAAADRCSKYEFETMLSSAFNFDSNLITPISIDKSDLSVAQPKNMTLKTGAARALLTTALPKVVQSIERYYELSVNGYVNEIKQMI